MLQAPKNVIRAPNDVVRALSIEKIFQGVIFVIEYISMGGKRG